MSASGGQGMSGQTLGVVRLGGVEVGCLPVAAAGGGCGIVDADVGAASVGGVMLAFWHWIPPAGSSNHPGHTGTRRSGDLGIEAGELTNPSSEVKPGEVLAAVVGVKDC